MKEKNINRRGFLKAGAMGIVGANLITQGTACAKEGGHNDGPRIVKYNTLGKTGLKVSDISLGGAYEKSVLLYAMDRGINLFDTAEAYYEGQHEIALGKALKGVRDKAIIITKHRLNPKKKIRKKDLIRRFDKSLERLQMDYVDIAMLHVMDEPEILENEEFLSAYEELKKAGKYRFLGFSTHKAEVICPPAFESNLFSVMLVIYNSVQYPKRSENIKKANELNLGVIAMKTMMGREQDNIAELVDDRTTFAHAAMKWALTDPCVNSVVITMRTFEHIEEYLQASGQALTPQDEEVLKKYVKAVDNRFCRIGCTACLASCPNRVAIPEIMRFGMYFENYGEEKKAMLEYAGLEGRHRAHPCQRCSGHCKTACPHGLTIQDRLMRYDTLLRV